MNRTHLTTIVSTFGLPAVVCAVLIVLSGCGPSSTKATTKAEAKAKADPWLALTTAIRDETDAQACRQLLADLNNGLSANPAAERPLAASTDELQAIVSSLRLSEGEAKFLASNEYTPLDAQYLAECLYLRDAAASLGLDPADPISSRATAAFNWVCRQVVLQPWLLQTPQNLQAQPPLPPAFVLRRGSGSGLERAYTFVALCRQLDLDACLVGTGAADLGWTHRRGGEQVRYPDGPFWAVGVRDGDDIRLFDPIRGESLPGKGTLADLRANPAVVADWRKATENPWTVPDDQIQAAELSVTAPISALAPRLRTLDQRVRAETNAKLAVDLNALVERLTKASGGVAVKVWNPPADPFTPVRVLDTVLPADQGGGQFGHDTTGLITQYQASLIPLSKLAVFPPELTNEDVRKQLRGAALTEYGVAFQPQMSGHAEVVWSPRERIQRGRHNEATKELVRQRDRFTDSKNWRTASVATGSRQKIGDWATKANALYEELSRAKVDDDRAVKVPLAQKKIDEFWLGTLPEQSVLLTDVLATAGAGEATYLLALSFHERAERTQLEADRVARAQPADRSSVDAARKQAGADWKSAVDWWTRYEEYRKSQDESYPGRAAHAQKLSAHASKLAAK